MNIRRIAMVVAAMLLSLSLLTTSEAATKHRYYWHGVMFVHVHVRASQLADRHHARRSASAYHHARIGSWGRNLPGDCRVAASLGGPCGCWAMHHFGLADRTLWRANSWLRFARSSPAPGTAAVTPGRHVAPVVAVNGDGTVTVADSWATHRVRMAGLVFVRPSRWR